MRNPHLKTWAYGRYKKALRNGTIARPDRCSRCGKRKRCIQGHHSNYAWPLRVVWLCPACHGDEHSKLKQIVHRRRMWHFLRYGMPPIKPLPLELMNKAEMRIYGASFSRAHQRREMQRIPR